MKTRVVNVKFEPYDVYIGRDPSHGPTYFGNPFKIGEDGTREDVLEKFRAMFLARIRVDATYRTRVLDLKGKTLGCHCKGPPEMRNKSLVEPSCHGDVMVDWLDNQHGGIDEDH